ncbi:MAG: hypothetical protein V4685_11190 [Bacteroidota bacterium]
MKGRLFLAVAVAVLLLISCKKDDVIIVPQPAMDYTDLHDSIVRYSQPPLLFDFDGDGFSDLKFGVVLVGDGSAGHDKRQFRVSSGIHSKLAVNSSEQVPIMNRGDLIPLANFSGYEWWLVSSVLMVERVENTGGQIWWQGHWQGAIKKYLPFQMIRNNQRFNGWVELTVDVPGEKIVLHRLAMCKEPEKEIKAG